LENNQRLARFNQTIQVWIDAVEDYSLEMLRQILDDTEWFVGRMQEALATTDDADKEMHEDAKRMFAVNSFPDILIQGPATNVFIPQPESREELTQRLVAIKETVNGLFGNEPRNRGKTRHPGLLYFDAEEWLQFAEMHMRHHLRQKARIDEMLRTLRP